MGGWVGCCPSGLGGEAGGRALGWVGGLSGSVLLRLHGLEALLNEQGLLRLVLAFVLCVVVVGVWVGGVRSGWADCLLACHIIDSLSVAAAFLLRQGPVGQPTHPFIHRHRQELVHLQKQQQEP